MRGIQDQYIAVAQGIYGQILKGGRDTCCVDSIHSSSCYFCWYVLKLSEINTVTSCHCRKPL